MSDEKVKAVVEAGVGMLEATRLDWPAMFFDRVAPTSRQAEDIIRARFALRSALAALTAPPQPDAVSPAPPTDNSRFLADLRLRQITDPLPMAAVSPAPAERGET